VPVLRDLVDAPLALDPAGDISAAARCSTISMSETPDVGDWSRRYGAMVLRRCRRLLRDDAEALDACQDVFVRVIERRVQLNGQYPSSLLFRIATNVCLNRIRDRGRRPEGHRVGRDDEEALLERIACAPEPFGESDARMLLDRLFNRHPESSRTMAVLHFVDGLTLEEVAEVTSMSVSGVRKRLRRLRANLRELLR
jgi:RNA polymerase sigma-70 factor (ECF subfamily)